MRIGSWALVVALAGALALGCGGRDRTRTGGADGGARTDASPATCGTAESVPDGLPCACDSDCVAGALCDHELASGYAGGTCKRLCETDDVCTVGSSCFEGACSRSCTTEDECGPRARSCGESGVCIALCQGDGDCDSGHCNRYNGFCSDGTTPAGAGIMEACVGNTDCRSELCHPTDGVCISRCSVSQQGCPDGAVCFGTGDTDVGLCSIRCESDTHCAPLGLVCAVAPAPADTAVCVPESWLG